MPAPDAAFVSVSYTRSPQASEKPMYPTVRTLLRCMRSTTASIINCTGCATVTTHGFSFGSSKMGVRPIMGVFASLPTCAMAMAAGTPEVPISKSTFSSSISLRALRPALLGSEPSSSTMSWTLRPSPRPARPRGRPPARSQRTRRPAPQRVRRVSRSASGAASCRGSGGVVGWWAGGSNEQLDRRQCAPGAEQIDALGADRPTGGRAHQVVARRAAQQGLLLAARLDVEERRAQPCLAVCFAFDARRRQHMLAVAGRVLRMRARVLQALHVQLQQQPVFIGQRVVRMRVGLRRAEQRHPVVAVGGEQGEPFVEPALVEQRRLVGDEIARIVHGPASVPATIDWAQARNWLRISSSFVPLVVTLGRVNNQWAMSILDL